MFRIPRWALKTTRDLDELLEWRLDANDVARMFHVHVATVARWADGDSPRGNGPYGTRLASRVFSDGPRAPRAFRLVDVQNFGKLADRYVDLTQLPRALAREWNIDLEGGV